MLRVTLMTSLTLDDILIQFANKVIEFGSVELWTSAEQLEKRLAVQQQSVTALKSLFVAVVGEDKPAWAAGEYQIIEDILGNGAEQLYNDMKLGYDQAKREIKTRIEQL